MQISAFPDTAAATDRCSVPDTDPARVATATAALVDDDVAERLARLFRLLGDPTRVRILHGLRHADELCVCDLASVVGAPETRISQALRLLRDAGVVRRRRQGRRIFYRLDDDHVRQLLDLSRAHVAHTPGRP